MSVSVRATAAAAASRRLVSPDCVGVPERVKERVRESEGRSRASHQIMLQRQQ